jgi:hypothetical protein
MPVGKPVLKRHVSAFGIAEIPQTLFERSQ